MLFRFANEKDSDIIMQGLTEIEYYERNNSSFFSDKDGTIQRKRIHDAITNNSIMIVEDGLYSGDDDSLGSDDSDSDSKSDSSVSTDSGITMNDIPLLKRQVAGFIWFTMTKKCFVGIDNCDFTDSYVYIYYVWVNKLIRGKGIAKKLYAKVIEYCKTNNIKKVWLDIPLNNKMSMDFHKKIGFEPQTILYSKCI